MSKSLSEKYFTLHFKNNGIKLEWPFVKELVGFSLGIKGILEMVIRARFSKEHNKNNYVLMKYTIYILYLLRIERESKAKSLDFFRTNDRILSI